DLNAIKTMHPKEAKMKVGSAIVEQFHGRAAGEKAAMNFEKTFSKGITPENLDVFSITASQSTLEILVKAGLAESKNEGRRLIQQGAVSLDGEKISDENRTLKSGILKVGKRRFLRLETKGN